MRTDLFASPLFIVSLVVLVVNDWVLKSAFHNAITGKLSDFAGVALFALFWLALLPRRTPLVLAATALGFAWWKSPLSQPAIDFWNASMAISIARTADYTDLIALTVLPLVSRYAYRRPMLPARRLVHGSLAACALAAMMGTSLPPDTPEYRARRLVWDTQVSSYEYRDQYIDKQDYERLVALLRRMPDKAAATPSSVDRRQHDGADVVYVTYDLPLRGVYVWFYPDDAKGSEFSLETPHQARCDEALVAGSQVHDPLVRARVDFRALPEGPWITGVSLWLCDVPNKRTYGEALRYFFDAVLPPIEAALAPREKS